MLLERRETASSHPKFACMFVTVVALILFHYFTLWLPTIFFWFVLVPGNSSTPAATTVSYPLCPLPVTLGRCLPLSLEVHLCSVASSSSNFRLPGRRLCWGILLPDAERRSSCRHRGQGSIVVGRHVLLNALDQLTWHPPVDWERVQLRSSR